MDRLPLGLPTSIALPGHLGLLSGDLVVLIYIFILLLLVSIFYFGVITWHYQQQGWRTPTMMSPVLALRGPIVGCSEPRFVVNPSTGRGTTRLEDAVSYATSLEHLAAHVTRKCARDLLISEVENGFVLSYTAAARPVTEIMTWTEIAVLPPLKRKQAAACALVQQMAQVRRFLDQQSALSIRVVRQQEGYYVEFATPAPIYPAVARGARVSRLLDDQALALLGGYQH